MREQIGEDTPCGECKNPYLWQTNLDAWRFYALIANKFVYDFHALPLVFEIFKPEMTHSEAVIFLEKLILIHGIISKVEDEDGAK